MSRPDPWQGFPYSDGPDRSGALIGHLLCGVLGIVAGVLLAHAPGVASSVCAAALRVLP